MRWINEHRNSRWALGLLAGLLVVFVGLGAFLLLANQAGSLSRVAELPCITVPESGGESCLRFPGVTGDSLTGQPYSLPGEFEGRYQIVVMPFDEEQQVTADTWLPLARDLANEYPNLSYYNVPVFPGDISPFFRGVIRTGLNAVIPDETLRERTITVFIEERERFLEVMAIPDTESLQVFLLGADGEVLWRSNGPYTETLGESLRARVETVLTFAEG